MKEAIQLRKVQTETILSIEFPLIHMKKTEVTPGPPPS